MKKIKTITIILLSLVLFTACGNKRDLSNVRTSLYGHWKQTEENKDIYFSEDKVITVQESGETNEYSYKVLEHDEVKQLIILQETDSNSGSRHNSEYTFVNSERDQIDVIYPTNSFSMGQADDEDEMSRAIREAINESISKVNTNQGEKVFKLKYIDNKTEPK